MLEDPSFIFRRMWAADAWAKMLPDSPACWNVQREAPLGPIPSRQYFDEAFDGTHCESNWYEGNEGELGEPESLLPAFGDPDKPAPAALGFDESLDWYCSSRGATGKGHAERCVEANVNILSLYGERVPYNICRNLEWQVCGARGLLAGQGGKKIIFARSPRSLAVDGSTGKPAGQCKGWVPKHPPHGGYGYATDDIFYLEVCMYAMMCKNGHDLFHVEQGGAFECDLDWANFMRLAGLLLTPATEPEEAVECKPDFYG